MRFSRLFSRKTKDLDVDDVFVDALNLSELDKHQLEGKFTTPIRPISLYFLFALFLFVTVVFGVQLFNLQVIQGAKYKHISENNSLEKRVVFAKRGVIKDRYKRVLVYNSSEKETLTSDDRNNIKIYLRRYNQDYKGLAHVLGYVKYPKADANGHLWRSEYEGVGGIEEVFNEILNGLNGAELIEKDAQGNIVSSGHIREPKDGKTLELSIDAELNDELYRSIENYLEKVSFKGGAATIMDVTNGEVIALVSVPEFDLNKYTEGDVKYVQSTLKDKNRPLLNRAALGEYTPGSIVKPFMALAALHENIISPSKKILSTGRLVLPNPYNPDKPTVFKDWKAHGYVDAKEAIAHSSDVYFYEIGGGFKEQEGLGIKRIMKYARLFGFGEKTGIELSAEATGLVPSPKWKQEVFGESWHIGNTYHTSIGQYGFLVTVLQAARYTAALANGKYLFTPTLVKGKDTPKQVLPFSQADINVVHDGMRMATNIGTARPLKIPGIQIAAKTGTAELGAKNERKNSWVIGFWPYKNPRFAFATMLENGDAHDKGSASHAMISFFNWLIKNKPEYVQGKYPDASQAAKKQNGKTKAKMSAGSSTEQILPNREEATE